MPPEIFLSSFQNLFPQLFYKLQVSPPAFPPGPIQKACSYRSSLGSWDDAHRSIRAGTFLVCTSQFPTTSLLVKVIGPR